MRLGRGTQVLFTVFATVVLTFVYVPIVVVTVNSFNSDRTFGWPPPGFTTQWWHAALQAQGPRDAFLMSVTASRRSPSSWGWGREAGRSALT